MKIESMNTKMNLWNVEDLALPPINTYKSSNKNVDIKHLYNVCQDIKNFFNNKYMHAEFLVLSRIIYRMKQKFRSSKDFKALEKVNKALEIYFRLGILSDVSTFIELIPSRYKDETYLPTKNMLDYLLVRFQGLAKLMERLVETCKISAFLLNMRIKTGHFWRIGFISFALVSRVYILAKYNANRICELYGKLLPFSGKLQNSGKNWLPTGYALPKDLKEWMNVSWLDFDDEVQIIENPPEIPDIIEFFDLVENDDDDIEFYDEYIMIDDAERVGGFKGLPKSTKSMGNMQSLKEFRGFSPDEDVGEVIEVKDIPESEMSNEESDIICLSDTSAKLVDRNTEQKLSDEDEVIVVPDISLKDKGATKIKGTKLNTKKLNKRKNKENVKRIEIDREIRLVLNNIKESFNKNKSSEMANKEKVNTAVVKRKRKKLSKNNTVKKIKLDFETSRSKNNNLPFDAQESYKICDTLKKNSCEQLAVDFGICMTSEELGSSQKRMKNRKIKKKKLKKIQEFSNSSLVSNKKSKKKKRYVNK